MFTFAASFCVDSTRFVYVFTLFMCIVQVCGWADTRSPKSTNSANVDKLYEQSDSNTEVHARTKKGTLNLSIEFSFLKHEKEWRSQYNTIAYTLTVYFCMEPP